MSTAWAARSGGSFAIALSIREGISSRVDEEAVAAGSDPTDESGTPPSRSDRGMYTSTFAHRRSTSAEEQLLRMDDGEPENSRGTTVHHSKQPSSLAESQRGCRVRDGGGGKKMERGKAHTVVGAAHHEERRLEAHGEDWRRVEQQPSHTGEKRERAEQQ